MSGVAKITISIEGNLLEQFDHWIQEKQFPTRSEAFKSLMRAALVHHEWIAPAESAPETLAGAITIVYDHHRATLLRKIVDIQHDFGYLIICSQHAHLDHHHCMECIIVHGPGEDIRKLHEQLAACKGMIHTSLSMTTTGQSIP
ncbi:MAG: nickel-responsive transcriptional regulator NikR [Thermoguttaceae bacterium]|nr:nickel-responsive transcriptional regulator NikR [Thermoguttaceae bacterium]